MSTNWNQPCCEDCWVRRMGARTPVRMKERTKEKCAWCGRTTRSGIFQRVDPATVRYPS